MRCNVALVARLEHRAREGGSYHVQVSLCQSAMFYQRHLAHLIHCIAGIRWRVSRKMLKAFKERGQKAELGHGIQPFPFIVEPKFIEMDERFDVVHAPTRTLLVVKSLSFRAEDELPV